MTIKHLKRQAFPDVLAALFAAALVVVAAEAVAGMETNPGSVAVGPPAGASGVEAAAGFGATSLWAGVAATADCAGALSGVLTVTRN